MSQIFDLRLATETLIEDAQQLGVMVEDLQGIIVQVSAVLKHQPEAYLQLQYRVTLPTESLAVQLDWPKWQSEQVGFADYLWEQTCLECFLISPLVSKNSSISNGSLLNHDNSATYQMTAYIELNASPDGRYAFYEFESYRNPAALPPKPLLQADGRTRASIDWINRSKQRTALVEIESDFSQMSASKSYHYERSLSISLSQLFNKIAGINDTVIEYINPCVILSFGATLLYFAPKHASPPDFHNGHYWSIFNQQAALSK